MQLVAERTFAMFRSWSHQSDNIQTGQKQTPSNMVNSFKASNAFYIYWILFSNRTIGTGFSSLAHRLKSLFRPRKLKKVCSILLNTSPIKLWSTEDAFYCSGWIETFHPVFFSEHSPVCNYDKADRPAETSSPEFSSDQKLSSGSKQYGFMINWS